MREIRLLTTFFSLAETLFLERKLVKHKTVAHSTNAEYEGIVNMAIEILWLKNLLMELDVELNYTPVLFCDNIGATYLLANPVFHSKIKHFTLDYIFVRQQVRSKAFKVRYAPTADQLANGIIKALAQQQFDYFQAKKSFADRINAL